MRSEQGMTRVTRPTVARMRIHTTILHQNPGMHSDRSDFRHSRFLLYFRLSCIGGLAHFEWCKAIVVRSPLPGPLCQMMLVSMCHPPKHPSQHLHIVRIPVKMSYYDLKSDRSLAAFQSASGAHPTVRVSTGCVKRTSRVDEQSGRECRWNRLGVILIKDTKSWGNVLKWACASDQCRSEMYSP
jgi:hypothetical protein